MVVSSSRFQLLRRAVASLWSHVTTPKSGLKRRGTNQWSSATAIENLESRQLLTLYDVGPGLAYTTIGAVPWSQLEAGDTVTIHGKDTPYHEMILISGQGTADAPIKVMGVLGPNGEKPIIDGQDAVLGPNLDYVYSGTPTRGLITVSPRHEDPWGYKPAYIEISGLEVRNAHMGNSLIRPDGSKYAYLQNAAGIFVERGENITIRDCEIDNNSNGLFVASGDSEEVVSRTILVQANYIHDNGNVGIDRQHNVYTEALGTTFEYNHFGPLLPGAQGNNLKDRSAGLVVRYNWFEGGAHLMDLVDSEDSDILANDPSYQQTYVYGNVLVNTAGPGNSSSLIHYGGDSGVPEGYRKGTLYFYQNTVMIQGTQTGPDSRWFTCLFQFDTNDQIGDVRNNIFYCGPAPDAPAGVAVTGFALFHNQAGTASFGVNWISPDWHEWRNDDVPPGSKITGEENFITNASNDPGFVDLNGFDFHLKPTSDSIDQSGPLPAVAIGHQEPNQQYLEHQDHVARDVQGAAMDLGAFEGAAPVGPGSIQFPAAAASVSEKAGVVHLMVRRIGGSTGTVVVPFTIANGTAINGTDFQASDGTLTFEDGQSSAIIDVTIIDNTQIGPDKSFQIVLGAPQGTGSLGRISTLAVTIQNDESHTAGPSTVRFPQLKIDVPGSSASVTITVQRTGDLSQAAAVHFQTKSGSAKAGKNFTGQAGQVQFAAGEGSKQIVIQLAPSANTRGSKRFKLLLDSTSSAQTKLGSKQRTVQVTISSR